MGEFSERFASKVSFLDAQWTLCLRSQRLEQNEQDVN